MLGDAPHIIPPHKRRLPGYPEKNHELHQKLRLLVGPISGIACNSSNCRLGLPLIVTSWRSGTQRQYRVYIRKWKNSCSQRKVNYLQASEGLGLDFLAENCEQGWSDSTINTAWSALSTSVVCDHETFGTHPHGFRLMKDIYNQRQLLSRYITMWGAKTCPVKDLSFQGGVGNLPC